MISRLLDSLEPFRAPDSIMAAAYEKTPAKCRAAIKTAIAITNFHFHPQRDDIRKNITSPNEGFASKLVQSPCKGALLIFPGDMRDAARVCGAASLAALSGVSQIMAIAIGAVPAEGVLTTLELCGVEDIFILPMCQLPLVTASFSSLIPIIYIDNGFSEGFSSPWREAVISSDFFYFSKKPRIVLLSPASFDREILAFCHSPNAITEIIPQDGYCDAIFFEPQTTEIPKNLNASLLLEPGCEGFWLFPRLDREFFMNRTTRFASLSESRLHPSNSGP